MLFDKEAVRAASDTLVVAEEIGLDIQFSGNQALILCPCHNDRHFGSCFLTKDGFRCYSCGHKGDVFDLVEQVKHVSFSEAVRIVANICGGEELFLADEDSLQSTMIDSGYISKKERQLIGLSDSPVFVSVGFVQDKDDVDEGVHLESSYGKNDELLGYEVIERKLTSPLYDLFLNNRPAFRQLVDVYCIEAAQKAKHIRDLLYEKPFDNSAAGYLLRSIHSKGLTETMERILSERIFQIQKISLIHGNGGLVNTGEAQSNTEPLNAAAVSAIQNSIWKQQGAPF